MHDATEAHAAPQIPTETQLELPLDTPEQPRPTCANEGCTHPAEVVLGVELYPPAAVMAFYNASHPITRMLMNLKVCRTCVSSLSYKHLMTPEQFLPLCKLIEQQSGTAVDVEATKIVPVELNDPDYLLMLAQSADPQAVEVAP